MRSVREWILAVCAMGMLLAVIIGGAVMWGRITQHLEDVDAREIRIEQEIREIHITLVALGRDVSALQGYQEAMREQRGAVSSHQAGGY